MRVMYRKIYIYVGFDNFFEGQVYFFMMIGEFFEMCIKYSEYVDMWMLVSVYFCFVENWVDLVQFEGL